MKPLVLSAALLAGCAGFLPKLQAGVNTAASVANGAMQAIKAITCIVQPSNPICASGAPADHPAPTPAPSSGSGSP